MDSHSPILQTRHLSTGYKTGRKSCKVLSEDLNLRMYPGELICLLGPNGSGKSTLIRSLSGLQPALKGTVEIEGKSIQDLRPADLAKKLSMVLTERVKAGNLNAYSLVALGRHPYTGWLGNLSRADKEKTQQAMVATGTTDFADRKVHELSDGECQKVMLARALAQDTPLIILDEPTAHLDLPNRVELMQLLHQLARQMNKAILLSSHDLDLALQAADQVWLLQQDGQLKTGTPEDLVLQGTFEAAFAREGFQFDKDTGTFNLHKGHGENITLSGEGAAAFWTRRALQREGFSVIPPGKETAIEIDILKEEEKLYWISRMDGKYQKHASVAALIVWIRKTASGQNYSPFYSVIEGFNFPKN